MVQVPSLGLHSSRLTAHFRLPLRLSPPSQKSAPHEMKAGVEILVGTIRFQTHERTTLTEEAIPDTEEGGGGKRLSGEVQTLKAET
jgi:hypothetical protein